ncbi:MAG: ABC transporter permease [Gemmatimonadetes bacterium]|nr:ABC transporter permease [Gemmatimonadota bacterium]
MTPEAARRKAMLDFGGVERFRERAREERRTRRLEDLLADLRNAGRTLRRSPGFATVTVLTLGLGIGANTALFSVVNGVLLEPLPYDESENLVYIDSYWTAQSGFEFADYPVGSPEYFDYKSQNRSLEGVAAVSTEAVTHVDGGGDPEVIRAGLVSPSLFTVLRTPPLLGRTLVEEDGRAQPAQVVVLSHDLWQRRFGGDSAVVGRRIALGMEISEEPIRAEIVGVMPPGFEYPGSGIQLWGPLPLDPARTWRGGHWFDMLGRLARGVPLDEAKAEMAAIMEQWAVTYPDHHVGHGLQMRPLLEEEVGEARSALLLLMGSVAVVLLIACANVASLLLARGEGRRREVAVRAALGAGRGRLVQHVLSECLLLALAGGVLGLVQAWLGVKGLPLLGAGSIPRAEAIGLDARVLAFTGGVVLLTTALFGLAPALRESNPAAADTLRDASLRATASPGRLRFRRGIVVSEVALSVILVVAGGLMVKSFRGLLREDPGFSQRDLLFAQFTLPGAAYEPEEAVVFYDGLVARARALPGVEAATLTSRPPLLWEDQNGRFHIEGRPASPSAPSCCMASFLHVGEGMFETLGIPLVRGRLFGPDDHRVESPGVAVVDEATAERWWPGEDPIGQRLNVSAGDGPWYQVVGVVGNVTYDGPGVVWPTFYMPFAQTARNHPFVTLSAYLTLRTAGDPAAVLPALRQVVREMDPGLAIAGTFTMDEVMARAVAGPRFVLSVMGLFAALALALAAIGIYGVMAYAVALQRGEIGIRRALGAEEAEVLGMVLRQGLALTGAGVVLGLAGAAAGTRILERFLHEVSPTDPLTFVAVALGVGMVAALASWLPARRATGVGPLEALRVG